MTVTSRLAIVRLRRALCVQHPLAAARADGRCTNVLSEQRTEQAVHGRLTRTSLTHTSTDACRVYSPNADACSSMGSIHTTRRTLHSRVNLGVSVGLAATVCATHTRDKRIQCTRPECCYRCTGGAGIH